MSRSAVVVAILPLLALGGCVSGTTHPNADEEIMALERSALDKWSQGNTLGYVDIGAPDVTWFEFTEGEQQRVEGLNGLREYLAPLAGQLPPHTLEICLLYQRSHRCPRCSAGRGNPPARKDKGGNALRSLGLFDHGSLPGLPAHCIEPGATRGMDVILYTFPSGHCHSQWYCLSLG